MCNVQLSIYNTPAVRNLLPLPSCDVQPSLYTKPVMYNFWSTSRGSVQYLYHTHHCSHTTLYHIQYQSCTNCSCYSIAIGHQVNAHLFRSRAQYERKFVQIRSPINENLHAVVENLSVRGNEGIKMEAKRFNVTAKTSIGLRTSVCSTPFSFRHFICN